LVCFCLLPVACPGEQVENSFVADRVKKRSARDPLHDLVNCLVATGSTGRAGGRYWLHDGADFVFVGRAFFFLLGLAWAEGDWMEGPREAAAGRGS